MGLQPVALASMFGPEFLVIPSMSVHKAIIRAVKIGTFLVNELYKTINDGRNRDQSANIEGCPGWMCCSRFMHGLFR